MLSHKKLFEQKLITIFRAKVIKPPSSCHFFHWLVPHCTSPVRLAVSTKCSEENLLGLPNFSPNTNFQFLRRNFKNFFSRSVLVVNTSTLKYVIESLDPTGIRIMQQ